ncbi:split-Soret cytochrome c precursor [bacterium BMS3Abin01]|nr:split-Soret cytochrome c precursor [bacterium BMS3Abin01]
MDTQETTGTDGAGRTLSRRELFPLAGKLAVGGVGLAAVTGIGLAGCGTEEPQSAGTAGNGASSSEWPWPYEKLNPSEVQPLAYESWYEKYCCYAVTNSILRPLQKSIGAPYTNFPIESTKWGHGGAVGWGTLCGTLTGVGIVTGLVAGEDGEDILNDVMNWYTVSALPNYQPPEPRTAISSISVSDSPLCHISVGKWMAKEGVPFASDPRKERCARLSADVAAKTVVLLNDWVDGKYTAAGGSQVKKHPVGMPTQNNCVECHGDDVPSSP